MEVHTFRADTMHEALALVRRELGPDAAILRTREVRTSRLFGLLPGPRKIEVTASAGVNVPSRLPPVEPPRDAMGRNRTDFGEAGLSLEVPNAETRSLAFRGETPVLEVRNRLESMEHMLHELCRRNGSQSGYDWPDSLFRLYTDLIDADLSEEEARDWVERVRSDALRDRIEDVSILKSRIGRMLESELAVCGPIRLSRGQRRVAALIGPTGVGKTTTIAKLAANFRLRENRRVGLITVDTYRIAAVEQLRTYADIIDLPMQVVSTPREMREAVQRFNGLDLVLIDTAGRSPKDEIKIRELRTLLSEARADEVHLVVSSVIGARALRQIIDHFQTASPTALLLTKLDEAPSLGGLLPVLSEGRLPLSYLTNGQNVPDDIEVADAGKLARMILRLEHLSGAEL